MTSRHQNTVEYIAVKSFLFISLKEKLDLTLFSVRRSHILFLIQLRLNYFTHFPRKMSLGRAACDVIWTRVKLSKKKFKTPLNSRMN